MRKDIVAIAEKRQEQAELSLATAEKKERVELLTVG